MKIIRRGEEGLTLIELLVVIGVLGVIAAIVALNVYGFFGIKTLQTGNETYIGTVLSVEECCGYSQVWFYEATTPPTSNTRLIMQSDAGDVEYCHYVSNASDCTINWLRCYYVTSDSLAEFITSDAYNFTWTYTLHKVGQVGVLDAERDCCSIDLYEIVDTIPGILVEMVIPEDWK